MSKAIKAWLSASEAGSKCSMLHLPPVIVRTPKASPAKQREKERDREFLIQLNKTCC
jgi:hypothetical protein